MTPVSLDNTMGYGQTKAGACVFRGKERVKELQPDVLWDATAGIRDLQFNGMPRFIMGGFNPNFAVPFDRLHGIDQNVDDDLLELTLSDHSLPVDAYAIVMSTNSPPGPPPAGGLCSRGGWPPCG